MTKPRGDVSITWEPGTSTLTLTICLKNGAPKVLEQLTLDNFFEDLDISAADCAAAFRAAGMERYEWLEAWAEARRRK